MVKHISSYFERKDLEVMLVPPGEHLRSAIVIRSPHPYAYLTSFLYYPAKFDDDRFWDSIHTKLQTLLYHKVLFPDKIFESKEELQDFIDSHHPKLTPQEKLDAVLEYIHQQTSFDGEEIRLSLRSLGESEVYRQLYLTNEAELVYYIRVLNENGYINYDHVKGNTLNITITIQGLNSVITIRERKNSRICFVAMSFSKELERIYLNAIAPAISENEFIPLLLRDEHVDADKTINDAILAGLKKAKFTVADFTGHRANVYFEAGFALGRGQKVIYSCRENEVEDAHFDTRNFQHIVWKNEEDFRKKLSDKIQAYIID